MGRRKGNFVPEQAETLSQETPDVQEKLLNDIIDNDKDNQDNQDEPVSNKVLDTNNLSSNETEIKHVEPAKTEFKAGDNVKLNKDIQFDMVGRRIHNGLKNYTYRVLSVRIDGMLIIECLTHCFTVSPKDVHKI